MQMYTIKEASKLSWLPESTLRYYETMWLIDFIKRDNSSKHRIYNEEDINIISAIACLNLTWMSIWDMKDYMSNLDPNTKDFSIQLKILKDQDKKLALEEKNLTLRRKYIKWKLKYYNMLSAWDEVSCEEMEKIREQISEVSKKMRFWDKK